MSQKNEGYELDLDIFVACPRCGKTGKWCTDQKILAVCLFCDTLYKYCDNNWVDRKKEPIQKQYSPIIDKLTELAKERYGTHVIYMQDNDFVKITPIKDAAGSTMIADYKSPDKTLIIMRPTRFGSGSEEDKRIIVLAHEIGHVVDYVERYNRNYKVFHYNLPTTIMMREQWAWRHSVDLLKEIGYTNWTTFLKYAFDAIGTYYYHTYAPSISKRREQNPLVSSRVLFIQELKKRIKFTQKSAPSAPSRS